MRGLVALLIIHAAVGVTIGGVEIDRARLNRAAESLGVVSPCSSLPPA